MRWFIFLPQYVQTHFFFEKNKEIRYNKSVVSGKILRQIKKEG